MTSPDRVRELDPANLGLVTLERTELWRVYASSFGPSRFNATGRGYARFSPIRDPSGAVVGTLYAGTTLDVALMEVVLRELPFPSAGFSLVLDARTEQRRIARLRTSEPIELADLSAIGLRRLGLSRADAIDCDTDGYRFTQALAEWIYAERPEAQGIHWTSRQDDGGQAVVLFEPRVRPEHLEVLAHGDRFDTGAYKRSLGHLLDRLGAGLVIQHEIL